MLNIFNNNKIVSNSALIDERSDIEKAKDYSTQEIASALAVTPFQNSRIKELTATVYNQWYVGSCVPHAFYTQLEYEGIAPTGMSQLRAYRKRFNYPSEGSNGVDMYNKIKGGQSNDFPTPRGFRESEAAAMPLIQGTGLIPDFKYFQHIDNGRIVVEDIPKDVAVGKAITIFIYATESEWAREYVEIKDENLKLSEAVVRHAVCLIPLGDFTKNGKQWFSVHDSAKFGGRHLRYISYDFLQKRVYFSAKVIKTTDIPVPPAPPVIIEKPYENCNKGDRGTAVLNLQKYLIDGGYLKPEYATGYYGSLTAKAVLWWQLFNHKDFTSDIPQLLEWGGKYWGSQSINVVKKLEG